MAEELNENQIEKIKSSATCICRVDMDRTLLRLDSSEVESALNLFRYAKSKGENVYIEVETSLEFHMMSSRKGIYMPKTKKYYSLLDDESKIFKEIFKCSKELYEAMQPEGAIYEDKVDYLEYMTEENMESVYRSSLCHKASDEFEQYFDENEEMTYYKNQGRFDMHDFCYGVFDDDAQQKKLSVELLKESYKLLRLIKAGEIDSARDFYKKSKLLRADAQDYLVEENEYNSTEESANERQYKINFARERNRLFLLRSKFAKEIKTLFVEEINESFKPDDPRYKMFMMHIDSEFGNKGHSYKPLTTNEFYDIQEFVEKIEKSKTTKKVDSNEIEGLFDVYSSKGGTMLNKHKQKQ